MTPTHPQEPNETPVRFCSGIAPKRDPALNVSFAFQNTEGLIFVVDSNDRERAAEARDELQRMLAEDELREAVLLVFANKQVLDMHYIYKYKVL